MVWWWERDCVVGVCGEGVCEFVDVVCVVVREWCVCEGSVCVM